MEFINIWKLLLTNGASSRKEEGTARYWSTLSPDQQQAAFNNISFKMAQGLFVHFDPIQAIRENIRSYHQPQPEWKTGGEEGEDLVQVRYNGSFKICTRATMERFNLEFVRNW